MLLTINNLDLGRLESSISSKSCTESTPYAPAITTDVMTRCTPELLINLNWLKPTE